MTLIVTVVTPSVIFQVSDRRVSWLYPDGSLRWRDDATNKAVLFDNRMLFTFTGFSELESEKTDMWIAHRLASEPTLTDGVERLRQDLTKVFRRRPYVGHAHSIMVAGWSYEEPGITGFSGMITNTFQDGRWVEPQPDFVFMGELAPPNSFGLFCVPSWLRVSETKSLRRKLIRVKDRGLHVANAIRLIGESIREASRDRPAIGTELMVATIPKSAAIPRKDIQVFQGVSDPEMPTFQYWSTEEAVTMYAPTMVINGAIMSHLQGTVGDGWTWGVSVSLDSNS